MNPSMLTSKADGESLEPTVGSRVGDYVDRASGSLRLEDGGRPDHTYARPSVWRPQNHLARPCRYLFPPQTSRGCRDSTVDVEALDEETPIPLPRSPAPVPAPPDPETPHDEAPGWAERISKAGWTPVQVRILPRAIRILDEARLHRLASRGQPNERLLLDEALEWSRSRLARLLEGVGWDVGVARWLHSLLLKHLSPAERAEYLAVLGRLRRGAPGRVEAMTTPGRAPAPAPPPLDRLVAHALLDEKFSRLPLDPIFLVVPNSPECPRTERFACIVSQLRQMAVVRVVTPPLRPRSATVQQVLDQAVAEVRSSLAEARSSAGTRPVVLVGWNMGAAIALLLGQLEPVSACVCVGPPLRTLDNQRSSPPTCPVMFVVGARSVRSTREDAEELRSNMRATSRLVVVGGCDDRLAMGRADRSRHRVTQSMVDRAVAVEIYNFVGETLTQPTPLPPRAPPALPAPPRGQRRPPRGRGKMTVARLVPHHNYAAPMPGPRGCQRGPPPPD